MDWPIDKGKTQHTPQNGKRLSGTDSCSLLINEVEERICLFADDKGIQRKLKIIEIVGKLAEEKPL